MVTLRFAVGGAEKLPAVGKEAAAVEGRFHGLCGDYVRGVEMGTTKVGLYHHRGRKRPYCVRWYVDYDEKTGRRKRLGESFRLKRDAERYQAQKQAEFDRGAKRDRPEAIPLAGFCDLYVERRNHEWREKTRISVQGVVDRLIGHFGRQRQMAAITPTMAARFWSEAVSVRSESEGAQLSAYTKNRILRDARTIFRYAITWGYILSNPFDGLKLIRVGKRAKRAWHYIKPEEYVALLKVAPDLRWKVIYALAYTSGARSGELFNLTEDCMNFETGRLAIKSRAGSNELPPFQVKDHEDREIPLPRHTLRLLAGWLRVRPKGSPLILLTPERYDRVLARWREYQKSGLPWINDYLMNNLLTSIRRQAKWAGLKLNGALTMHAFRKSAGQNWANHLPMNVVKELLGHSDIATTAEFYATVTAEHEAQAQWVMQAITVGSESVRTADVVMSDARMTQATETGTNRRVG